MIYTKIMQKLYECKKCREKYPAEGFVFVDGGFGSEWDLVPPCKKCRRSVIYRDRYGITLDEAEVQLQKQGFVCGICSLKLPSIEVSCIDMDRQEGCLRGIVCDRCSYVIRNTYYSPTWLRGAATYLEKHAESIYSRHSSAVG